MTAAPIQTDDKEGAAALKWIRGEIDPCGVRILHATTPRFSKWLHYAKALERQTRAADARMLQCEAALPAGCTEQAHVQCEELSAPPQVKISWNPLMASCDAQLDSISAHIGRAHSSHVLGTPSQGSSTTGHTAPTPLALSASLWQCGGSARSSSGSHSPTTFGPSGGDGSRHAMVLPRSRPSMGGARGEALWAAGNSYELRKYY